MGDVFIGEVGLAFDLGGHAAEAGSQNDANTRRRLPFFSNDFDGLFRLRGDF